MRGVLALGALFPIAFASTRTNSDAGLFLFMAVISIGLAVVPGFARGLQGYGGAIRTRTGESERNLVLRGLLVITSCSVS